MADTSRREREQMLAGLLRHGWRGDPDRVVADSAKPPPPPPDDEPRER